VKLLVLAVVLANRKALRQRWAWRQERIAMLQRRIQAIRAVEAGADSHWLREYAGDLLHEAETKLARLQGWRA